MLKQLTAVISMSLQTLPQRVGASSVIVIGIAYSGQEKPELPVAPHDEKLDMVLTEKGLRHFPKR